MCAHFNHEDGSLPLRTSTAVDDFSRLAKDLTIAPSLRTKQRLLDDLMALLLPPHDIEKGALFDTYAPWVIALATTTIPSDATLDRLSTRATDFTAVEGDDGRTYVMCMYSSSHVDPFRDPLVTPSADA